MKQKYLTFTAIILLITLNTVVFAVTDLGGTYMVAREDSPYAAEEGAKDIKTLPKGKIVRLIKDETLVEAVVFGPFRILKLMIHIEPRGNWLVEDEKGNRGYMWDSDLKLIHGK